MFQKVLIYLSNNLFIFLTIFIFLICDSLSNSSPKYLAIIIKKAKVTVPSTRIRSKPTISIKEIVKKHTNMNVITLFSINPELTNDIAIQLLRYTKNQE